MPLDSGVSAVLSQTCTHSQVEVKSHTAATSHSNKYHRASFHVHFPEDQPVLKNPLTNSGLVKVHIEGSDQALQERPDQPEVDASDTPGAIHQNNDVGYGLSLTQKRLFS